MKALVRCVAFAVALSGVPALWSASPPAEGKILIPRLGVEGTILEGADDDTLRVAVGHIPGTALPGSRGNAALAAHRYGYFKGLSRVRKGDRITVTTPVGTFHYAVEHIEIVEITDVSVLDPTPTPTLTLVTCYPFDYIGAAPQRLIVKARQLDEASAGTEPASATPDDKTSRTATPADPAG